MAPRRLDPHEIASALPPGARTLVAGCSGESLLLADAVKRAGERLGAMTFTGIFVPGLNTRTYLANPACRVETFFLTPELKAAGSAVKFLPLCYADILVRLRSVPIDAALFMTTTPDADGNCGFGPVVDFLAELWPRIPVRIAHINPRLPRVEGPCRIPFSALTAYVEAEQELLGLADAARTTRRREAIGEHVARFDRGRRDDPDGPRQDPDRGVAGAAGTPKPEDPFGSHPRGGRRPRGRRRLWRRGVSVTGGVAIGSRASTTAVGGSAPIAFTRSPTRIRRASSRTSKWLVSLNSALEVDLFGQAYAEIGPGGLMSGPGGASDFARGVWAAGGLRIVGSARGGRKGRDVSRDHRARTRGLDLSRLAGWIPTSSSPNTAPPTSAGLTTTNARRR